MTTLDAVRRGIIYSKGFCVGGKTLPFYSFTQPDQAMNWSDEMDGFIAETSRNHFLDRYNRTIVLRSLAPHLQKRGAVYMDIGCSSGYLLEDVISAFPQVEAYGSDYLASGLAQCHKALPNVPLFQLDITNSRLPTGHFDAVSCLNVLEHVKEDVKGIKELHRILKPGGTAIATVPAGPHLFDLYDDIHMHVRRYTLIDLVNKFREVGFKIQNSNYFGVAIYPAFYARKKLNQYLYGRLSLAQKKIKGMKQAKHSSRMPIFEKLCNLEARIGAHVTYPFGIRAFVVAQK